MKNFSYLKTFLSPFKRPKLKWYIGKIAVGVPYFYPSKWSKLSHDDIDEKVNNELKKLMSKEKEFGKDLNIPSYEDLYKKYKGYTKRVTKHFGFDFVTLGWKTKWSETDYRFEWAPIWSFVFWKWQIALIFKAPEDIHYWEAWLFYENNTDKSLTKQERIQYCKDNNPQKYRQYKNGEESLIDYYELILKDEYL